MRCEVRRRTCAEYAAEHADGQKKERRPRSSLSDPVRGRGCNDAVDMRMKLQALVPAMEHAEETDLGSEMPWIAKLLRAASQRSSGRAGCR